MPFDNRDVVGGYPESAYGYVDLDSADLAKAMSDLIDSQRVDYFETRGIEPTDSFNSYANVVSELTGSPAEKARNQSFVVGEKEISDGPIYVNYSDGYRIDDVKKHGQLIGASLDGDDQYAVLLGEQGEDGVITDVGMRSVVVNPDSPVDWLRGKEQLRPFNHYEGPLGSFDYDTLCFSVAYKNVGVDGADGYRPILYYIGNKSDLSDVEIPKGCVNIDYMCDGNERIVEGFNLSKTEGIRSAFGLYSGCTNLEGVSSKSMVSMKDEMSYRKSIGLDDYAPTPDGHRTGDIPLPDSIEDLGYFFYRCPKVTRGFTLATMESKLLNMDGYGYGTQLPMTPSRGLDVGLVDHVIQLDRSGMSEFGVDPNYYNEYNGYGAYNEYGPDVVENDGYNEYIPNDTFDYDMEQQTQPYFGDKMGSVMDQPVFDNGFVNDGWRGDMVESPVQPMRPRPVAKKLYDSNGDEYEPGSQNQRMVNYEDEYLVPRSMMKRQTYASLPSEKVSSRASRLADLESKGYMSMIDQVGGGLDNDYQSN